MYCGYSTTGFDGEKCVSDIARRQAASEEKLVKTAFSIRVFAVILLVAGAFCDVISMLLVFNGSMEVFSFLTVGGTVAFILGLVLTFVG